MNKKDSSKDEKTSKSNKVKSVLVKEGDVTFVKQIEDIKYSDKRYKQKHLPEDKKQEIIKKIEGLANRR